MNVGSVNYHPGGNTCTYKGEKILCLIGFSDGGSISGHIIANVLRHLDDF